MRDRKLPPSTSLPACVAMMSPRGSTPVCCAATTTAGDNVDILGGDETTTARHDDCPAGVDVELPPAPPPGGSRFSAPLPEDLGGRPLTEVKRELREANAELVLHLVRFTGMSHREVNGELNRLAGVSKVTEATADQLQRRLVAGERWVRTL